MNHLESLGDNARMFIINRMKMRVYVCLFNLKKAIWAEKVFESSFCGYLLLNIDSIVSVVVPFKHYLLCIYHLLTLAPQIPFTAFCPLSSDFLHNRSPLC